jgi:hypothetical protein
VVEQKSRGYGGDVASGILELRIRILIGGLGGVVAEVELCGAFASLGSLDDGELPVSSHCGARPVDALRSLEGLNRLFASRRVRRGGCRTGEAITPAPGGAG